MLICHAVLWYFQAASQKNLNWQTIKLVSYNQNIRGLSTNRNTRSILYCIQQRDGVCVLLWKFIFMQILV